MKKQLIVPSLSAVFLLGTSFSFGLRSDHFALIALVNSLYFISDSTRRFITGFSIFVVYWILYDSMKAVPNYTFTHVDIEGLYLLEKKLFGISTATGVLTPNEFFLLHQNKILDLVSGFFYLCWIPVPLAFAFYLFFNYKKLFLRFSFAFFIINLVGFVVYYSHPAAPPWYVQQYGFVFDPSVKTSAAGLLRSDSILGFPLFASIYTKGSNVFGAMPSLHAAYLFACFYYGLKQPKRWLKVALFIIMTGIWFSAIYLSHHYILDVLAGIVCGITGILILEKFLIKRTAVGFLMRKMEERISEKIN